MDLQNKTSFNKARFKKNFGEKSKYSTGYTGQGAALTVLGCHGSELSNAKCFLLVREQLKEDHKDQIKNVIGVEKVGVEPKYLGLPMLDGR